MSAEQGWQSHHCPGHPPFTALRFKTSLELFEAKVRKSVEDCTLSALAVEGQGITAEGSGSEQSIQLCEGRWSQAMRAAVETAVAEKQVGPHHYSLGCGLTPPGPAPYPLGSGRGRL